MVTIRTCGPPKTPPREPATVDARDIEDAFAEYSSTATIATAMIRGVERGWPDAAAYDSRIDAAWEAILTRTGSDGTLVDVCESTNKQATLALIFATGMMARKER